MKPESPVGGRRGPVEVVALAAREHLPAVHYFVARRAGPLYTGRWEFPGGKVRPGEALQEALRREMQEELSTGVHLERQIARLLLTPRVPETGQQQFVAITLYLGRFTLPPLVGTAHTEGAWRTPDQIRRIPRDEQMPSLLEMLTCLEARGA